MATFEYTPIADYITVTYRCQHCDCKNINELCQCSIYPRLRNKPVSPTLQPKIER